MAKARAKLDPPHVQLQFKAFSIDSLNKSLNALKI